MPLLKEPRHPRARIGEQRSPGEVRPVTTRTVVGLGVGVVVLVALAIGAVLWASSGTPKRVTTDNNLPKGGLTTYVASYAETVQPSKGAPVAATLSLQCAAICTEGDYSGYAGNFTLKVDGQHLLGTAHPSCETESLVLQADLSLAVPAQLPQSLTGRLTRASTCPGTDAGASVTLKLNRTH